MIFLKFSLKSTFFWEFDVAAYIEKLHPFSKSLPIVMSYRFGIKKTEQETMVFKVSLSSYKSRPSGDLVRSNFSNRVLKP